MSVVTVLSLLAVVGLAVVHLFSNRLRFLNVTPRSIWLSIFGGISVSYVFVHLLPELAEGQQTVVEALDEGRGLAFLQSHIYLVALLGLVVFYGLERLATSSRRRKHQASKEDSTSEGVF